MKLTIRYKGQGIIDVVLPQSYFRHIQEARRYVVSVLQPLQGDDHFVFDHNQNKIAEDKEMGGVDHFSHRVCHLDLRIQPVRPNPLALRALPEEIFPAFNMESTFRSADVLTVIDCRRAVDKCDNWHRESHAHVCGQLPDVLEVLAHFVCCTDLSMLRAKASDFNNACRPINESTCKENEETND